MGVVFRTPKGVLQILSNYTLSDQVASLEIFLRSDGDATLNDVREHLGSIHLDAPIMLPTTDPSGKIWLVIGCLGKATLVFGP